MTEKEIIGLVSIIPGAIGFGTYIWSFFIKHTKPHAFTWITWTIVNCVVFAAQYNKGAGAGSWTIGFGVFACFVAAVLAVWRGERKITRGDTIAFAGGLATIPLWYFTKDPLGSVILATVVDGFAFYPTFRKSWLRPNEESAPQYIIDSMRFMISFWAMEKMTLTSMIYPVFVIIIDNVFALMVIYRRAALKKS